MSTLISAPSRPAPGLPPGFSLPRSTAIAAALSLHLALAALLAMPIAAPDDDAPPPQAVPVVFETPRPPPPIAPPPPLARPVTRVVPARPQTAPATPTPTVLPNPVAGPTVDVPSPLDLPATPGEAGPDAFDAGPAETSLLLRVGPAPRYPRAALARRLEGEVELLILVGVDGTPESVSVSRSSGHAVLDRAAREQVLRHWVFEPSLRNGIAVPAYARVPVRFTLP